MAWASRIKPWRVRRLYRLARFGIYDHDLLLEVGWGLYVRCEDVLTVTRAVHGRVPCPQCGHLVDRPKYHRRLKLRERRSLPTSFSCPTCRRELTWQACRNALRGYPKCFRCAWPLDWHYAEDRLTCSRCGILWERRPYQKSIGRRLWLPCPYCGTRIRRPDEVHRDSGWHTPHALWKELTCPRCGDPALHVTGKLQCPHCGYEQAWKSYYCKRLKRRNEHLQCGACGYRFTWKAWHERYRGHRLLRVGNSAAVEQFLSKWPACKEPHEQLVQIDLLLHALHGAGAMAPSFIEGDRTTIMELLDELAR